MRDLAKDLKKTPEKEPAASPKGLFAELVADFSSLFLPPRKGQEAERARGAFMGALAGVLFGVPGIAVKEAEKQDTVADPKKSA